MNLDLGLLGTLIGGSAIADVGIRIGSQLIARLWGKERETFITVAGTIDEKAETKLGVVFPEWVHAGYNEILKQAVRVLDYAAQPIVVRRIERWIMGVVDPTKRAAFFTEFYDYLKGKAKQLLSEELKAVVNDETQKQAVIDVSAKASLALPPEFVATRDIKADVKAAVIAVKHEDSKPLSDNSVNEKIAATKEKLAALVSK